MTYDEIAEGGIVLGGRAYWSQLDAARCPACNVISEVGSGGFTMGGSAPSLLDQIGGGYLMGGSATVDLAGDVYDGLAGCWPLDEESSPFIDHTRNQFHGVGLGELALDAGVGCGLSQLFSGQEAIEVPPDTLTTDQPFAMSMWLRLEDGFNARVIFNRGCFTLGHTHLRHLQATITGESGAQYVVYTTKQLEPDRWYHVACSWDRGTVRFFVDGTEVASGQVEETTTTSVGSAIYIGGLDSDGGFLLGNIQEVRLFGDIRSALWFRAERDNLCRPGFYTVSMAEET